MLLVRALPNIIHCKISETLIYTLERDVLTRRLSYLTADTTRKLFYRHYWYTLSDDREIYGDVTTGRSGAAILYCRVTGF